MEFLKCDNLNTFSGYFFSLVMVRGKRRVFVGLFPYRERAVAVASSLDWQGFKSEVKQIKSLSGIASTQKAIKTKPHLSL